jgi:hypothetical protein
LGEDQPNGTICARVIDIRYRMNEILAPLYYLEFQKYNIYAESEVFFMFSSLMTFLIDMHIKDMD